MTQSAQIVTNQNHSEFWQLQGLSTKAQAELSRKLDEVAGEIDAELWEVAELTGWDMREEYNAYYWFFNLYQAGVSISEIARIAIA